MGASRAEIRFLAAAFLCAVASGAGGLREPVPSSSSPASPPERAAPAKGGEEEVRLPPDLGPGWYAWFDTSLGQFVARLLPEQAPRSVAYFAALAEGRFGWTDPITGQTLRKPYYDGLTVTRAVASERFEMGERMDAGRYAPPLFVPPEGAGPVTYTAPGRLGMKRSVMNRISGVKFVVTAGTLPLLAGRYPCFGEVVSGLDVVARISEVRTDGAGTPLDPVVIQKLRIVKVGTPAPLPEPQPYMPQGEKLQPRTPSSLPLPQYLR